MRNGIYKVVFVIIAYFAMISAFLPWYSDMSRSVYWAHSREEGYDGVRMAGEAVRFNPFSIEARFALADAQRQAKLMDEARKSLDKAAQLEPLNYYVWQRLGFYEALVWDNPDQARLYYQKAIELNPKDELLRLEAEELEVQSNVP